MLTQKTNPRTNRKEYALVSMDGKKVLQYFGRAKPSPEAVAKVEARVEYYKNKGKS
jgi:hypothetical protein